jgi:hypothetical protein
MRGFSVTALLVALVFAAGCGGGGGGGGSSSAARSSGEAAKPARQVVSDAAKAAESASSVHMSGQVAASGKNIGVDLSLVRGKGASGSITLHGAKIDLVLVGKNGYLRAGADFWKQFGQAGAFTQLLADKWLQLPAGGAQFGPLTGLANERALFDRLTIHGKLVNQGETTYQGQSVVAVHDTRKNTTLYVAASGTPYPVALLRTGHASAGTLTFDGWNESVTVTAPQDALDISQLGSG